MKRVTTPTVFAETYNSPAGPLIIGETDGHLCLCDWAVQMPRISRRFNITKSPTAVTREACSQLERYFAGLLREFTLPVILHGTPFQTAIWEALRQIPYGHTESYSRLAVIAGHPGAVRAVANAVGANPASIIVPCHRIIGANGSLTGYAGGLEAKRILLDLERRNISGSCSCHDVGCSARQGRRHIGEVS